MAIGFSFHIALTNEKQWKKTTTASPQKQKYANTTQSKQQTNEPIFKLFCDFPIKRQQTQTEIMIFRLSVNFVVDSASGRCLFIHPPLGHLERLLGIRASSLKLIVLAVAGVVNAHRTSPQTRWILRTSECSKSSPICPPNPLFRIKKWMPCL